MLFEVRTIGFGPIREIFAAASPGFYMDETQIRLHQLAGFPERLPAAGECYHEGEGGRRKIGRTMTDVRRSAAPPNQPAQGRGGMRKRGSGSVALGGAGDRWQHVPDSGNVWSFLGVSGPSR